MMSMATIEEFELAVVDYQEVEMPLYSRIVSVQARGERLVACARVEGGYNPHATGTFWIVSSNYVLPSAEYVGTVQHPSRPMLLHVFHDLREWEPPEDGAA